MCMAAVKLTELKYKFASAEDTTEKSANKHFITNFILRVKVKACEK